MALTHAPIRSQTRSDRNQIVVVSQAHSTKKDGRQNVLRTLGLEHARRGRRPLCGAGPSMTSDPAGARQLLSRRSVVLDGPAICGSLRAAQMLS